MLQLKKINDGLVKLDGRFNASQVEKAEALLSNFTNTLTIDMSDLEYISSAGLGMLLRTLTRLKDNGSNLILKNMNKHIREVLKYSGLDKIFVIDEG